jgi:AmiR/NasT family two-component response regulator
MNDTDIQQRFQLMQRELESTVSLFKQAKLDLTAAVDSLKLELEVMKMFMERYHPDFSDAYQQLREEAMQAIDPEWTESAAERK